ncbi:MAG: hypothetical protein R2800_07195 [Flavipsychrobacter sp.]
MNKSSVTYIWRKLVGDERVKPYANRIFNSVSLITIALLFLVTVVNLFMDFTGPLYINLTILIIAVFIYYLSRFRDKHYLGIIVFAICSYVAVGTNYFYNSGIKGPTIFTFFLTFQLIIALTKRSQHLLWAVLHIGVAVAVMLVEYYNPSIITDIYNTRKDQYVDIVSTYVLCLFFIYLITIHLRNSFAKEKRLADERANEIKTHLHRIENQNEKLKEISWLQSHKVRSQVATILGLCQFIDERNISDKTAVEALKGIKQATEELDKVVKEINEKTKEANLNPPAH